MKFSSREFRQDPARAEKAVPRGPVFTTDQDGPVHVLLGGRGSLAELLALPAEAADIDLPLARVRDLPRPAGFD